MRLQQLSGGAIGESLHMQLGQSAEARLSYPSRMAARRMIGSDSTLRPINASTSAVGPVEPLSVLDDQNDGRVCRGLAQQLERGKRDQEQVRGGGVGHAERDHDRVALKRWKVISVSKHRPQELVQARERKVRFGLNACRAHDQHPAIGGEAARMGQKRRLPNTGVASHDQRCAPFRQTLQQAGDHACLVTPANQRDCWHLEPIIARPIPSRTAAAATAAGRRLVSTHRRTLVARYRAESAPARIAAIAGFGAQ